jgi:hypothetical protein
MNIIRRSQLFLFILAVSWSQAQVHQGMYSLRGSFSYASTETDYSTFTQKTTSFSFSPAISVFLTDNLEINWALNYNDERSDGWYSQTSSSFTALLAGARLYLPMETTALFAGASIGYSDTGSDVGYQVEGGLDYFLSPTIALEPVIVISRDGDDYRKMRGTKLYIGFRYFMP